MNTSVKILYWAPRVLGILTILFVSLFSLDSFERESRLGQKLTAFAIHLIPTFSLCILLTIAWKREFEGGILLVLIGVLSSVYLFYRNYQNNHSVWISLGIILSICFPFIIAGILFILHHNLVQKNQSDPGIKNHFPTQD